MAKPPPPAKLVMTKRRVQPNPPMSSTFASPMLTRFVSAGGQEPLRSGIEGVISALHGGVMPSNTAMCAGVAPYAPEVACGSDCGSSRQPKQPRARWCWRSCKTVTRVKTATREVMGG
ncbi:unnamed protein product [Ectocarpus sp. 6 AP-2014]